MKRTGLLLCLLVAAVRPGLAQDAPSLLDQIGPAIQSGHLAVDVGFRPGRGGLLPAWQVEASGAPNAHLAAEVAQGRVQSLSYRVEQGDLVLVGRGLRPDVVIEEIEANSEGLLTKAVFHGRGLGRPIVAIFRPLVLSSLKKIRFHTEVAELFRGNLMVGEAKPAASPAPAEETSRGGGGLLDLVSEVRIADSTLGLFEKRRLDFGPAFRFETAADPERGEPLRLSVVSARYRPRHGEDPGGLTMTGGLECSLASGELAWSDGRLAFAAGRLEGGRFEISPGPTGSIETRVRAAKLALRLTDGLFHFPGGVEVDLAEGSRLAITGLEVSPHGEVSGTIDATLLGKTGEIRREGSRLALTDVRVASTGLRLAANRASGEMTVEFDYRLAYPFVVQYPVSGLPPRRIPLDFRGPLSARLQLEDVGPGDQGKVGGTYSFRAPWAPIERAAFEVIRARWEQDEPLVRRVSFSVEPTAFRPCGRGCFYTKFRFTAEKLQKKKKLFRQECEPEGRADLVIDRDARAFLLKNVQVRPQCKGAFGWLVNLIAPLLTKTYGDMVLFRLPEDLPFTVDAVDGDETSIEISGRVAWAATTASQ